MGAFLILRRRNNMFLKERKRRNGIRKVSKNMETESVRVQQMIG